MVNLIKKDPFFTSLFSRPVWLDDFDETTARGLKIHETDKKIVVEAVVAGIPANDVEVNIENGILRIKAEKKEEEKKKGEYLSSSRRYYYTAALSGGAWNKARADIEDGVVTITIPKAEAAKPRKIAVRVKSSR
ncbi:Hsp20/alpha crystallin family protein [Patescibacteria group bacterium]|nr:Hsp20/alpha crystallin family protein [Patescibacteria group bacterium]